MQINANIKKARELKGYSQAKIAVLLGEKRSTYAEWERETVPKADILQKIAQVTGVSMAELLDEKAEQGRSSNGTTTGDGRLPEEILLPLGDIKRTLADYISMIESYNKTLSNAINAGLVKINVSLEDVSGKIESLDQATRINQHVIMGSLEEIAGKPPGTLLAEADTLEHGVESLKNQKGKKQSVRR